MEKTTFHKVVINAASAINTKGAIGGSFIPQIREFAAHCNWSTGVSVGEVKIEAADDDAYTGTWAPLATVTYSAGSPNQDIVQITGTAVAYRARISTGVVGGTVTVTVVGT